MAKKPRHWLDRDTPIEFACPHADCAKQIIETPRRLQARYNPNCPHCHRQIILNDDDIFRLISQFAERTFKTVNKMRGKSPDKPS